MSVKLAPDFVPGLEGIVAAQTRLSRVDGQRGELIIGGYPLEELAGNATYEEVVYLLWYGTLPNAEELSEFRAALAARRTLAPATLDLLRAAAAERIGTMDALRMAAGSLSLGGSGGDAEDDAMRATAAYATIVAAYARLKAGNEPVAPRADLRHAANFLYMLDGEEPSEARTTGMKTYLVTVIDHGLNASTFTARVIASTQSDLISALTGAVGALKGPLHGGAPGPALDMVFEIGEADKAEAYIRAKMERGERLMGFGHRVYKVRDPRADVLSAGAERFYTDDGDMALYHLARHVEETAIRLLEEYKPGRRLQTNVEYFTALLLHGVGLSTDLFAPTFAVSRAAGWAAHCLEQMADNRLIRPSSIYTGEADNVWVPIEDR